MDFKEVMINALEEKYPQFRVEDFAWITNGDLMDILAANPGINLHYEYDGNYYGDFEIEYYAAPLNGSFTVNYIHKYGTNTMTKSHKIMSGKRWYVNCFTILDNPRLEVIA